MLTSAGSPEIEFGSLASSSAQGIASWRLELHSGTVSGNRPILRAAAQWMLPDLPKATVPMRAPHRRLGTGSRYRASAPRAQSGFGICRRRARDDELRREAGNAAVGDEPERHPDIARRGLGRREDFGNLPDRSSFERPRRFEPMRHRRARADSDDDRQPTRSNDSSEQPMSGRTASLADSGGR